MLDLYFWYYQMLSYFSLSIWFKISTKKQPSKLSSSFTHKGSMLAQEGMSH